MATTSMFLRATDQNTSQENMINNPNEPTKPRGRKTSRSQAAPKKQPQRGLGVAQLEQLRIQEQYEQPPPPPTLLTLSNQFQYPLGSVPVLHYDPANYINGRPVMIDGSSSCQGGSLGWDQDGGLVVQRRSCGNGNGYLMGVDSYPYVINGAPDPRVVQLQNGQINRNRTLLFENSKELSSIPKFPCVPDRCEFCFKRMRFNVSNNLGFDQGERRDKNTDQISPINVDCDFLGLNLDRKGSLAEVKKIHRKGSVAAGKVLMEYEFFPGNGSGSWKNSTGFEKLQLFPTAADQTPSAAQLGHGEASSCIMTDHYTTSYTCSNAIDLSLKLSY